MVRALVVALGLAFIAGCGAECIDRDRDGRGAQCALGLDCDDDNAARAADCDAVPPPDCALDPTATGCPCLLGSVTDCFPGAPELSGIGECTPGRTSCIAGHWGLCAGSAAPQFEICDELDQDCDGTADEGARSPCGGCTPGCAGDLWGEPFEETGEGLAITERGELTLARGESAGAIVWAANSAEGTASRIDGARAIETARYATGDRSGAPLEPSRVAVDWNGDAWIANRAFEGTSSVVRIASDRDRCIDRDGDGGVETSADRSDVRAWGEDECVLASVEVGARAEVARAIAIDGDRGLDGASGGNAWIGLHDGQAFVEVDGLLGTVRRRIETPGFMPYSAAFDPWGILWAIARDGLLMRLDPTSAEVTITEVPLSCWLLYGLAIDAEGRLAMTGFSCDQVALHDPRIGRWSIEATEPSPRGAAFDGTDLWIAHTGGTVSRLVVAPTLTVVDVIALASDGLMPLESIGMGADGLGHVWAISSQGGPDAQGLVTRVSTATGEVDAQVPIGAAPHSQGDPTGAQLLGEFTPEASATHVFTGCSDGPTRWLGLHAAIDPGTHGAVRFEVRRADDAASLAGEAWTILGTIPEDSLPFELAVAMGGVLEVRATLTVSARIGAPRIGRIGLEWSCPGPD